jgi:hypothetical protein
MYKGTSWTARLQAAGSFAAIGAFAIAYSVKPPALEAEQPPATTKSDGDRQSAERPSLASEAVPASNSNEIIETHFRDPGMQPDYSDDYSVMDERIHFLTQPAEARVRAYRITCPQPGKTMRLMDVLRQGTRQHSNEHVQLHYFADHRGDEVRITHQLYKGPDAIIDARPIFTLNAWGEWRVHLPYKDPVMNLCYIL